MEPTLASNTPSRPEEELQFIRKILDESRARFAQSGEPYIVWGLIIAIGMGLPIFPSFCSATFTLPTSGSR